MRIKIILILFFLITGFATCKKPETIIVNEDYDLVVPDNFPEMPIPADNPMTKKGVELGRMLFYEPKLSKGNGMSCGSCHAVSYAFSDNGKQFSKGVDSIAGNMNTMALINIAWFDKFFWDGRAKSMEEQVLGPIQNPIEMHETLENMVAKLQADPNYPNYFNIAFGTSTITADLVAKAIAQFERTMIAGENAIYRKLYPNKPAFEVLESEAQIRGHNIFFSEQGDCFHCHGTVSGTNHKFDNNGLDSNIAGTGLGKVNSNPADDGKFKIPTLYNAEFTAPYMHDGRFKTLEEVIEHYNSGLKDSKTLHPKLKFKAQNGGMKFTEGEKKDLLAFLKTFTDTTFMSNPEFRNPFK